jgi:general secretion pathway protein K
MAARPPRGFALLVVLWTVALLALLGSHITGAARQAASLSLLLHGAARAEALADGLVAEAIFRLLDPSSQGWKADGVPRAVRLGSGVGEVVVLDHAGRINPSLAPAELLASVLRHDGVEQGRAERLAAAIVDWRSFGDIPLPGGAKLAQYRAAGLSYGPPHEAFRSPEELGLVLGMTPDVLARLQPHLSVWTRGRVRLEHADPVVAQAVRDTSGLGADELQQMPAAEAGPLVAEIVARVTLREAQAVRRVVVRFDPAEAETPQPWHILAWH